MTTPYIFDQPLQEATIIERPNRFIVIIELNGERHRCHCPVSGRIGGFTVAGLKCLVSGPYANRGTSYTMEALALEPKTSPTFQWIGTNQTRCNAIVEHFLKTGALDGAFPEANEQTVRREKNLDSSRIDFLVDDKTFIEVKMPLLKIHAKADEAIPLKTFKPGNPSERLPKQMKAMTDAIATRQMRGAMVVTFLYENTKGTPVEAQMEENIFPDADLLTAKANGLEQWKLDLTMDEKGVYFRSIARFKASLPTP